MQGEATARSRPQNALLEADLEFEHVGKVVPVVTEESVKSLEEKIKARITEVRFLASLAHDFTEGQDRGDTTT